MFQPAHMCLGLYTILVTSFVLMMTPWNVEQRAVLYWALLASTEWNFYLKMFQPFIFWIVNRMAELVEKETEAWYKMDPDPFDNRHPGKIWIGMSCTQYSAVPGSQIPGSPIAQEV